MGFVVSYVCGSQFCVGIFLHGYPYGVILFPAAHLGIIAMTYLFWFRQLLEYLAGEIDSPPDGFSVRLTTILFWGLWWGVLAAIVYIFSGQSSKFIYIDF